MRETGVLGRVLCALGLAAAMAASGQESLRIEITEGRGAVVPAQSFSSRRFSVTVKDGEGAPVAGATVHFRLPPEGPSGMFASGMRTESTATGPRGDATVYGIRWGPETGPLEILVVAVAGSRRGQASIPVEISASAAPGREDRSNPAFRRPSGSKRWIFFLAAGAGAAVGLAAAGGKGGGSQTFAPPAAVMVPPSIGTPTVTIGKP